ncbi:Nitrate reductase [NADH] 1 [Teratosphaeria destructans]|uniref:Nitrate reductase [NADH] 1 n=1 Tax=Teratosphaeria destructans TaxID=418781 RepID=A0A9W7STT5_9PEZI|nr:Nitrate reductase [NADH] 1 [Teratosphaeria destructans]
MPHEIPWTVRVADHPGSSAEDVKNEPDWSRGSEHRVGLGWRYVLDAREDWVKREEDWPANVRNRKEEEEEQVKGDEGNPTADGVLMNGDRHGRGEGQDAVGGASHEEADWKKSQGEHKHHDAYAADDEGEGSGSDGDEKQESEYERLLERYTPQEIALLRALQHEKEYRQSRRLNDGKRTSAQTHNRSTISIDEQDQFGPDNWRPRSGHLIRLTGKHPLNAEAELSTLYDAGLITPNELHYWLQKMWVTDHENESPYHIWDNRVLPSFITAKDGGFANTMFAHPDTACNEQDLNSVIAKPAQGETMPLD